MPQTSRHPPSSTLLRANDKARPSPASQCSSPSLACQNSRWFVCLRVLRPVNAVLSTCTTHTLNLPTTSSQDGGASARCAPLCFGAPPLFAQGATSRRAGFLARGVRQRKPDCDWVAKTEWWRDAPAWSARPAVAGRCHVPALPGKFSRARSARTALPTSVPKDAFSDS